MAGFDWKKAREAEKAGLSRISALEKFKNNMAEIGFSTSGFDYYAGDLDTLRHMRNSFSKMAINFPDETKDVTIALRVDKDPGVYGWVDPGDPKTICFNRKAVMRWANLEAEYQELVQGNFFPKGTTADSIFFHEFGHSVWLQRGGGSLRKQVEKVLLDMGYGHVNVQKREMAIIQCLSKYATRQTNPALQEVVAESFSEWYNGDNPREFCSRFLKEVGIT